jgi:GxxExxY protein
MTKDELNRLTGVIIGAAIKVHRELGPGLLESAYEACLEYELKQIGLRVERQKEQPVRYQGILVDCGYRIDLLVEGEIVLAQRELEVCLRGVSDGKGQGESLTTL